MPSSERGELNEKTSQALLIVNADDYGYFDAVSRGILDAHARGIVTATGILATGEAFDAQVTRLADYPDLDLGVHLNLTYGVPLSDAMRTALKPQGGYFPGKFSMVAAILRGGVSHDAVESEWRAQIERCLAKGLSLRFLNSHEHIHMLPPLYRLTLTLARHYGIPHVRFTQSERLRTWSMGSALRGGIMAGLALLNGPSRTLPAMAFLGLAESGRLGSDYMRWTQPALRPGRVHELMCHPGYGAHGETRDPRLLEYHDWDGERVLMTHPDTRALLARHGIRLVGYRHIEDLAVHPVH
jgi:chitin disaccharide deacetylase